MTPLPLLPRTADEHAELGRWYAKQRQPVQTQAQLRTALALGLSDQAQAAALLQLAETYLLLGRPDLATVWAQRLATLDAHYEAARRGAIEQTARTVPTAPPAALDHNRFWRMRTLAEVLDEITAAPQTGLKVLDIGGGDGLLALFLPEVDYVLAEPGTNGITAQDLPFDDDTFDVVLSCHVLEHIPEPERESFLATLCRLARREVVLLNPFRPAGSDPDQGDPWLEMVWRITQAPWAKEHLDCGFPALADVEAFAAAHGYGCRCAPNGQRAVSTLHVLLNHYAGLARKTGDLRQLNELLNGLSPEVLDSAEMPTAWLVQLDVSQEKQS